MKSVAFAKAKPRGVLAFLVFGLILNAIGIQSYCQKKTDKPSSGKTAWLKPESLGELSFRSVGPALTSGRVGDIAVDPSNPNVYYVVASSGGVWKTTNRGTSFAPIFDGQGSYSIGCISLDPSNPHVVWVGTGENNSQRSVGYGDGVYKSEDGGKSWTNMGLKKSEHVGKILIDPLQSDVVYVAAQGPLWAPGGDRGLYKSTDGGKTWHCVLSISENTGVSDLVFDPRDSRVIYAVAYQRRRHVWTLVNGGPESAIYKSTDSGQTWKKLGGGLPAGPLGRIGIAVSPMAPDYVYALIEANDSQGGIYRSTDRGASFSKMSGYATVSAQYYQEIFCDLKNPDRLIILDTWTKVSDDGGRTFRNLGNNARHVDDHAFWMDPSDDAHYLIGGDGGLYETFDRAETWDFKANLPITQFYRVAVDQSKPFYYIYGGTQDNNSLGGPSRTINASGIVNSDWFITNGGDGFESQVDPKDPSIVYAQSQYGGLIRFDRRTGEQTGIRPTEETDDQPFRWNWDSPLLISPHQHHRLYFAANFLFRSDDQGNQWKKISPDLTRQVERDRLPVFGSIQSMDAVAKNASTSLYGNIVALTESPLKEGLIYTGSDDGLICKTSNGGDTWERWEQFPGIPAASYVSSLTTSRHKESIVYASFDNHKNGDFRPYLLRSMDGGKTWENIASNLPENGPILCLAEDHIKPGLLFVGTEFGIYFSPDDGKSWTRLSGGLPVIAIRDIAIHEGENDLVLASFGRGFYVLDDYSPLRDLSPDLVEKEAHLFSIGEGLMFKESTPLGGGGKASQGEGFYTAPNPQVGVVFTWYLKQDLKSRKQIRQEKEKEALLQKKEIELPGPEELYAEDQETAPFLMLSIRDASGQLVRKLKAPATAGIHRLSWDFRYASLAPARISESEPGGFSMPEAGFPAVPGNYYLSISKVMDGLETELIAPTLFQIRPLSPDSQNLADHASLFAFHERLKETLRSVQGAIVENNQLAVTLKQIRVAVEATPTLPAGMANRIIALQKQVRDLQLVLLGNETKARRNMGQLPSLSERVESLIWDQWSSFDAPTGTAETSLTLAIETLKPVLEGLRQIRDRDLKGIEEELEKAGAPYTPGRIPRLIEK